MQESAGFFKTDDDFRMYIERALRGHFGNNLTIEDVQTVDVGWTNIVKKISTSGGTFIARFPRDKYWEKVIVKDYEFSHYIHGFTGFETSLLTLGWDDGRPFSFHQMTPGNMLAERVDTLSPEEVMRISDQISHWMYNLHTMSFEAQHIFDINNIGLHLQPFMDELLREHLATEDLIFWHKGNDFEEEPEGTCLIHGDFNASNIIVDNAGNIAAVIDFGFGGFGSKYFDISRIVGRTPPRFKEPILTSYERYQGRPLDRALVDKYISIWAHIDQGYINYMRRVGIGEQ